MNMRELLKFMVFLFCAIVTGLVLYFSIVEAVLSEHAFSYRPVAILGTAFLSTLPTIILIEREKETLPQMIVIRIVHCILTMAAALISINVLFIPLSGIEFLFSWFGKFFVLFYVSGNVVLAQKRKKEISSFNRAIKRRAEQGEKTTTAEQSKEENND